jgi:hypothetical protein
MLHLNVSKVDRVLHMRYVWEAAGGANDVRDGVGNVWGGAGPLLVRSLASPMQYKSVCSLCAAASGH